MDLFNFLKETSIRGRKKKLMSQISLEQARPLACELNEPTYKLLV